MAQFYMFFNSALGDRRRYVAQDLADYFGDVLSTGLLHTDEIPELKAFVESGTMNTIVDPGRAIMKGHRYVNTTPHKLEHNLPEPDLDRIDRVVLRLDMRHTQRNILLHIIEGESADNPVPPELQRDDFIYEISLAQIRIRAGASTIRPEDLRDERLDENLCGLVYSLISIPTSQFLEQWDLFFSNISEDMQQTADEYKQLLLDAEQAFQSDRANFEQEWDDWFSNQQTEGFVMASEKGQPDGIPTLNENATVPHEQLPPMDYVPLSEKGASGGIATLDNTRNVPASQLDYALPSIMPSKSESAYYYTLPIPDNSFDGRTSANSWTKIIEIRIGLGGSFLILFMMETLGAGQDRPTGEARIYRNGTPVGAVRSIVRADGLVSFSEVINGWKPHDLLQVYARRTSSKDSTGVWIRGGTIRVAGPLPLISKP